MKTKILTLTLAAAGAFLGAQDSQAQGLPTAAQNLRYNLNYLYDLSLRVGDYGYAVNDLASLNRAADRFAYTLSYSDYMNLRYSYDTSVRSWNYLRSYSYEPRRFSDVQRDMSVITRIVDRPLPPPPPPPPGPRVITVTGEGSGGTNRGDRNAACYKAQERALFEVAQACSVQVGRLIRSQADSCACRKKPGSRDDYTCRVQATGSCQISGRR